ncbi:hypothetical protein [Methanosalsum zhilinae]|uniref:hypothetical protein n=1 Tax=Methanosalsum zhilinae TaxID=39669 RepID=UPI0012F64EBF|nr:hypothetical protein [Methanosalsum zhilinae]
MLKGNKVIGRVVSGYENESEFVSNDRIEVVKQLFCNGNHRYDKTGWISVKRA